jgi:hypothetical protein
VPHGSETLPQSADGASTCLGATQHAPLLEDAQLHLGIDDPWTQGASSRSQRVVDERETVSVCGLSCR